jgi:hypothetical protein
MLCNEHISGFQQFLMNKSNDKYKYKYAYEFLIHPSFYPHHPVTSVPPLIIVGEGTKTIRFETQSPSLLVDVVCLPVLINEQCCVQTTPGHSARVPHVTNTSRSSCSNCSVLHTECQATM